MSEREEPNPKTWKPTLADLQEALNDESHPRHQEAIRVNRELAEKLAPTLRNIQASIPKIVAENFSSSLLASLKHSESFIRSIQEMYSAPKIAKNFDPFQPPEIAVNNPYFDSSTTRHPEPLNDIQAECTYRIDHEQERAKREIETIELLTALVASVTDTNLRLEETNKQIQLTSEAINASNQNSSKDARRMLRIGKHTFFVAILGVLFQVLTYVMDRFLLG